MSGSIAASTAKQNPNASSWTFSYTPVAAGNTIIIIAATFSSANQSTVTGISDTTHSTALTRDYLSAYVGNGGGIGSGNYVALTVWRLQSCSSGAATFTVTTGNANDAVDLYVWELSGVTATPYESSVTAVNSVNTINGVTSITVTAAAAVAAGDVVLSLCEDGAANNKSTTTSTGWLNDFSLANSTGAGGYGTAHLIPTSGQTPAITWNESGGASTHACPYGIIVAYQGGTGSTDPFPLVYGTSACVVQQTVIRM